MVPKYNSKGGNAMRFDKKVISKLLIISSLLLGSVSSIASPAIANAATAADPITATTTATPEDTTNTDPKTSTVTVQILSGILTLDKVPDFNFGAVVLGKTTNLKSNSVTDVPDDFATSGKAGVDGSSDGMVKITESRSNAKTGATPGFTLNASISPLYPYDTTANPITGNIMTLNSVPLVDSDNNNISTSSKDLMTSKAAISDTDTGSSSLMDLAAGSYRMGTIEAKWQNPGDATMFVNGTNGGGSASDAKAKKYSAVVTWTLTAKPSVTTTTK